MVNGIPPLFQNSTFDNFVVDDNNRKVFQKCVEYASNPNGFLTLTGTTGSGKTHLAVAIAKSIPPVEISEEQIKTKEKEINFRIEYYSKNLVETDQQQYQSLLKYYRSKVWHYRAANIIFLSSIRFLFELNDTLVKIGRSMISKIEYLNNVLQNDCVILDDLGAEKLSEASRQNLFFLIDECYVKNKHLIVTSNNTIEEINSKEPRIASRLSSGHVLYLNAEDYRTKKN